MDKKRILTKIDEMDRYLDRLESKGLPKDFEEYERLLDNKLIYERLLHLSIECLIDICNIIISNLKLGLPSDEEDMFVKLERNGVVSKEMKNILIGMKGMRNILVHKYGDVKDELVFEALSEKLGDFEEFKEEVLKFLNSKKQR